MPYIGPSIRARSQGQLRDFLDVQQDAYVDGDMLFYDSSSGFWVTGAPSANSLNEFDISSPVNGQGLIYNSTTEKFEVGNLANSFSAITGTPTTLAGYGITDAYTSAQVDAAIANLVDSAPGTLDTLNELAAALGDDANFATTTTNALATKASLTGTETLTNKTLGATTIAGHLVPDTDISYDLGSTNLRFRDLYLSGNTITLGDQTISTNTAGEVEFSNNLNLDGLTLSLERPAENLVLNVHSPDVGQNIPWKWSWKASLLYGRSAVDDSAEGLITLYRGSTYEFVNFAYTQQGSMTQAHGGHIKSIEGAGIQNLVPGTTKTVVTRTSPFTGQNVNVEVINWTIPTDFDSSDITLVQPSGISYGFINSGSGGWEATAVGQQAHGPAAGINPTLGPLYRGSTYSFVINASGHPFYFTTDDGTNYSSNQYFNEYTDGVTGSRTDVGTITFTVPSDAPDTLYYQCGLHSAMRGEMVIRDLAVVETTNSALETETTVYFQHGQEGMVTPLLIKEKPPIPNSACILYDGTKFVLGDMVSYLDNITDFENQIINIVNDAGFVTSAQQGSSNVDLTAITTSIVPDTDVAYDLGSSTYKFRDLYLSGSSIEIGPQTIQADADGVKISALKITDGVNVSTLSLDAGGSITETTGTGVTRKIPVTQRAFLYQPGELQVITGTERWYAPFPLTINKVVARLGTAADAPVDIKVVKNTGGTTIATDLTLTTNATKREISPNIQLSDQTDDYLTVNVNSIGTNLKGEDLHIIFYYTED